MNSLSRDCVLIALKAVSDDRGYSRITLDKLALDTGFSRSTVKRALTELVECGAIRRRVRDGRTGGVLIRLETGSETSSETSSKPVQNEPSHHVFDQGAGPEGALSPLGSPTETGSTGSARPARRRPAHRPAARHEIPESGAELVYDGPNGEGRWTYISPTMWLDPNGFTVSTKSMTPELKLRLGVSDPR